MTPEAVLPNIAEIAITVAGFTGLIVSFRPASSGSWTPEELIRVLGVVVGCIITAFCSLLPFGIAGLTSDPFLPWAFPLFLSGAFSLTIVGTVLVLAMRAQFRFVATTMAWILLAILAVLSVLSLLSSIGLVIPFSGGLLVLQLAWSLVIACVTLVATLAMVFHGRN